MLYIQISYQKDLDVFSIFPVKNALQCPEDLWFEAITSSLKLKHSVLILEEEMPYLPQWDPAKRFDSSDNWSWLAPRGLSVISETYRKKNQTFQEFKIHFKNAK